MKILKKYIKWFGIILGSFIALCGIGIVLIFYGPLTEIRELIVTSAMTTFEHQYIARIFLNDEEIQKIMDKNKIMEPFKDSNISDVSIPKGNNSGVITHEEMDRYAAMMEDLNKVEVRGVKGPQFVGYLMTINDPSRIQLVCTNELGKTGKKLKEMISKSGTVGGINAGGFADDEGVGSGGIPTGCIIQNGRLLYGEKSEKYQMIGMNKNNVLVLGSYTFEEAVKIGMKDAVSFGPYLVVNGDPIIKSGNGGYGIAPRTAIGQTRDGKILFLVIDGRQVHSIGATLKDVQNILIENGAYNAANLDGGASTTMYWNGKLINKVSSPYGERDLPTAFAINREMFPVSYYK